MSFKREALEVKFAVLSLDRRLTQIAKLACLTISLLTFTLISDATAWSQSANLDYSELTEVELQSLAETGDMHAIFTQGYNLIFEGINIRPDPDFTKAKRLLERANEGGHETANSILLLYYEGEFGDAPDPEKMESLLTNSAKRGSAVAKLNYAYRFIQSDDTDKSDQAFKHLLSAAVDDVVKETAYPLLIETLYGIYFDTHKNLTLARQKALTCSELWPENQFCHFILGRDFENGWGGDVDMTKRDFHFMKAAELGDSRAQWTIGMQYLNGDRVEANEETAYSWVKKSADQEHLNGLISFAVMNAVGQGTKVDKAAAFTAYETAAALGSGHAIRGLGSMYCSGEAPKKDMNLCAAALILAYQMRDDQAPKLLNNFFDVTDQASFDALKNKTAPARATLISRYDIQL